MSIKIAPSILSADFIKLGEEIRTVEKAGADLLHLDVMDGHMVPNITFGPPLVKSISQFTTLFLEAHLMITNAENFISPFKDAGANRIIIHAEATSDIPALLKQIKASGAQVGISIKPKTKLDLIIPYLDLIDLILFMTVEPGFGGQAFMPEVMPKLKAGAQLVKEKNLKVDLEVDGGIDTSTAKTVIEAGANILVAGSALFREQDRGSIINALREP